MTNMKHELKVYTLEGKLIRYAYFETAQEAYEYQKEWLKENDQIYVERLNDGDTMTLLKQSDIL